MKSFSKLITALLGAVSISACSTIIEGTSQNIAISTSPSGGYCTLQRNGQVIATAASTPAEVRVDKTKDDILVNCSMVGYAPASQYLHSGIAAGTYGNIIAGGLVGWGVDSMTGADNEYPSTANLNLAPLSAALVTSPSTVARVDAPPCTKEEADLERLSRQQGYQFDSKCR